MTAVSVLPKLFRWVFAVLAVLAVLCAVAISLTMVIDPRLPAGTTFGPMQVDLMGQPGTVALRAVNGDSDFTVTALRGNATLYVEKAGGLLEVLKYHGLPLVLISSIFLAVLFDLLRRLFRNVGHGKSFTSQSVTLVQLVSALLIVFSLISALVKNWLAQAIYAYLAKHAVVTISGTPLHLPSNMAIHSGYGFASPMFFSGLLVLALSEVFRQGVALQNEQNLTV